MGRSHYPLQKVLERAGEMGPHFTGAHCWQSSEEPASLGNFHLAGITEERCVVQKTVLWLVWEDVCRKYQYLCSCVLTSKDYCLPRSEHGFRGAE